MLALLWTFLEIYQWLLIARVMLSWFPDYSEESWYQALCSVTDPYLNLFKGWIPLIGGTLDLSPMIAFFALYWLRSFLYPYI
jgi:YggT family protein